MKNEILTLVEKYTHLFDRNIAREVTLKDRCILFPHLVFFSTSVSAVLLVCYIRKETIVFVHSLLVMMYIKMWHFVHFFAPWAYGATSTVFRQLFVHFGQVFLHCILTFIAMRNWLAFKNTFSSILDKIYLFIQRTFNCRQFSVTLLIWTWLKVIFWFKTFCTYWVWKWHSRHQDHKTSWVWLQSPVLKL